jgi:hypothetical protein
MTTPEQPPHGYGGAPGHGIPPGPTPYGQQQPYGAPPQPPHPGAYGWGAPGMPPPAPKKNTAKVWGIIGAVVALLVIGTVGTFAALNWGHHPKVRTSAKYALTVPRSLVDGEYQLSKDISQMADSQVPDEGANAHGIHSVGGQYSQGLKSLTLIGIYGTIDDPDESVDSMIHGMTSSPSVEMAVPEENFLPSGSQRKLSCGVFVKSAAGQKITVPFCVWSDSSTTVAITEADGAHPDQDPKSIDLQDFANKTDKAIEESRRVIG